MERLDEYTNTYTYTFEEKLLGFLFAFLAFITSRPYIFWEQFFTPFYSITLGLILLILLIKSRKYIDPSLVKYTLIYLLLQIVLVMFTLIFFTGRTVIIFHYLSFGIAGIFLAVANRYKLRAIKSLLDIFAFVFLMGIIEYFLTLYGIISPTGTVSNEKNYLYYSFYFTVVPEYETLGAFYRFCSMFNEPGVVGTLCGLVLFVMPRNNFRFYIFLIAGVISFSLAFYVLLGLFIVTNLSIKRSALIVGLFAIFVLSFGTDVFDQYIFSRFSAEDEGGFMNDNRTSVEFDVIYNEFLQSKNVLWGEGLSSVNEKNVKNLDACSWKMIFIERGVLGFSFLILFFAWSYFRQYGFNSIRVMLLFLAYLAALYQRAGYMFELPYFIVLYGGALLLLAEKQKTAEEIPITV